MVTGVQQPTEIALPDNRVYDHSVLPLLRGRIEYLMATDDCFGHSPDWFEVGKIGNGHVLQPVQCCAHCGRLQTMVTHTHISDQSDVVWHSEDKKHEWAAAVTSKT